MRDFTHTSVKATHIAARIWCDPEMKDVAMDPEAAEAIAAILDEVLIRNRNLPVTDPLPLDKRAQD